MKTLTLALMTAFVAVSGLAQTPSTSTLFTQCELVENQNGSSSFECKDEVIPGNMVEGITNAPCKIKLLGLAAGNIPISVCADQLDKALRRNMAATIASTVKKELDRREDEKMTVTWWTPKGTVVKPNSPIIEVWHDSESDAINDWIMLESARMNWHRPFSERHPDLASFLGALPHILLGLMGMCAVLYLFNLLVEYLNKKETAGIAASHPQTEENFHVQWTLADGAKLGYVGIVDLGENYWSFAWIDANGEFEFCDPEDDFYTDESDLESQDGSYPVYKPVTKDGKPEWEQTFEPRKVFTDLAMPLKPAIA